MKKYCLLKSLRTTALVCALMLLPLAAFAQDAVQADAADDIYASHFWVRRALNTRYSIDRSSVAPAYHAGVLAFANTLTIYGDVGYENYIERTDIEPLGDDGFYQHDRFAASTGVATPVSARLGLGAELKYSSMIMETSPINYGDDTFSAVLNAGFRLSRRTALGRIPNSFRYSI